MYIVHLESIIDFSNCGIIVVIKIYPDKNLYR